MRKTLLGAAAALTSGCGLLYTNVRVPRSYRSATPIEVKADSSDALATGSACNQSVLYLVAWGEGGYASAVKAALASSSTPDGVLYDVRADQKVTSILLGLYTKTCTVVSGRVAKR